MSLNPHHEALFDKMPRYTYYGDTRVWTQKGAFFSVLGRSVTPEVMEGNTPNDVRAAICTMTALAVFGGGISGAATAFREECPDLTVSMAGHLVGEAEYFLEQNPPDAYQDFTLVGDEVLTTTRMA